MISLEKFGQRLKECRENKNLTTRELADIVGTSAPNISRYENAKHGPGRDLIAKLASFFGVNPAWLMGAEVDKYIDHKVFPVKQIPILGYISAGAPIYADNNIEGYQYVHENENVDFCLRVKGDSMINARIFDNDLVFVRQQPEVETGEIAAVIIDKENTTLKRFYSFGNSIVLKPENPKYKEQLYTKRDFKDVRIIGKVVSCKFKVEV